MPLRPCFLIDARQLPTDYLQKRGGDSYQLMAGKHFSCREKDKDEDKREGWVEGEACGTREYLLTPTCTSVGMRVCPAGNVRSVS